jgi:hypothetical protein
MFKQAVLMVSLLSLTGCHTIRAIQADNAAKEQKARMQVAKEEAATAVKECRDKRLSGELKTYLESAQCSGPRIIEAYQKAGYRYMDLQNLFVAARAAGAEKIDNKELTETQEQLQIAELAARLNAEEQRRNLAIANANNQAAIASAAQQQANATLLQGLTAFQSSSKPAVSTTNCIAYGNSANCTSVRQ